MDDNDGKTPARRRRGPTMVGAIAFGCLLILAVLVFGPRVRGMPRVPRDAGGVSVNEARLRFQATDSNEDLVTLVKALAAAEDSVSDAGTESNGPAELARYGSLLLARAREGTIDLQKADPDEDLMLAVLARVRQAMAKHPVPAEGE